MTKAYSEVRQELAKQSAGANELPCRYCGAPTAWETLSNLGARCRSCYDAYCRSPQPRRQAQTALPRTPGRVNVMRGNEPPSAGPEHAVDALPFD